MHNWHLLLLAFLAVLQPIASFTDRNLVDGRQQCTTRSANRDDRLTLYGTTRNSKYNPEDRRVNYRETVEARQENRRYEVSDLTHSERRIVDSLEREHRLGPHREARSHQTARSSSPEDRARETREDARRNSSARREVREISRSARDVRHDARDSREFSDRASTTERRADSRNDRMSRIPVASRREEREPTRQPRYVASFRVARRDGDEVAQRESSRVREDSRYADKSRIVRDDTRRDSEQTQERRSLDRVAERRDLTERRSTSQDIFRDRESSRLADTRHAERDNSRRDTRQMEKRQNLNRFSGSRVVRERRSVSLDNFREREETRLLDNRRTERVTPGSQRDTRQMLERQALNRFSGSRVVRDRRSVSQDNFREREETRLLDNRRIERDSSRCDTREMEERLALNRFAESRVVRNRHPISLENFREREESLLANSKRTKRASSRSDTQQTEARRALDRFAERQGDSERRSVSQDIFREREETRLIDNRRTERASSRRDIRQMNERQARFSERRDIRDRRSVSLENFREREESRLADNSRTERANSRRDSRKMEESRVREQNRREISERRMSIPETLRIREEISLADGRRTERISSQRVHENSEKRRSLESRIAHSPSLNSRDASRNRDIRDESRISRVDVPNEHDRQRMIPMQRLAVEKRETNRVNRERDMRNVARESSHRSAFTRGLEERQARIRSTEARGIRRERVAGNRRDTQKIFDTVQRIQKERRSVSESPRRMNLDASDERKDTRLQRSAETRNIVVRMQERRHLSVSSASRRMNQSENRNSRDERRETTMELSKRSETRNDYFRMQDREGVLRKDLKIRDSTKTHDTRKMQREQYANNRIGSRSEDSPRSMRMEARKNQHLALERDVIPSRQASEKTSSEPGQLFMKNWHYLLYTVQGLYLCSMLAEMLGVHQSEKKIRSHGFWSASKIIKVD